MYSSKGGSKKRDHKAETHEKREKISSKMTGSRMARAFERVEHDPLYTHHKGKPSGCME